MASWVTHLRIADELLDTVDYVHQLHFIVGNIAPDAGEPNEDGSEFKPPTSISHWKLEGIPHSRRSEKFKEEYLKSTIETNATAFYLGYYVHLLTDYIWVRDIYPLLERQFGLGFDYNTSLMQKIKRNMFEIDCIYLKKHPNFNAFSTLIKIKTYPNVYLKYFQREAFEKKIVYIKNYYSNYHSEINEITENHSYIGERNVNNFVIDAKNEIHDKIKDLLRR